MWGQLRTMDDGLDWPSFLVGDVPRLSRCQSPHKFRGAALCQPIDFLFWKVWTIVNDTSRPPSTFNVTLTWTCSHFSNFISFTNLRYLNSCSYTFEYAGRVPTPNQTLIVVMEFALSDISIVMSKSEVEMRKEGLIEWDG